MTNEHTIELDAEGSITRISGSGHTFSPHLAYTLFQIDGATADVSPQGSGHAVLEAPGKPPVSIELRGGPHITVTAAVGAGPGGAAGGVAAGSVPGAEISFAGTANPAGEQTAQAALTLMVPLELTTVIHAAEYRSTGRRLDSDMPLGESYRGRAAYNFLLLALPAGGVLRFMVPSRALGRLRYSLSRHPDALLLAVTWETNDTLTIELFSDPETAQADFIRYLERERGVLPRSRRNLPGWVGNVPLVLTVDMLRSNGEIEHDFADVSALASDLAANGCPANTVFYLPGWNGDYDAGYPFYEPHPDLGGEAGFRSLVAALHRHGYRVLVHTNPQGIDPYHPRFGEVKSMRRLSASGGPAGWQVTPGGLPPAATLGFRTPRMPATLARRGDGYLFTTVPVLDACEAIVEVGGLPAGSDGVRVSIGRRVQDVPAGRAASYRFPYAMALAPGENQVVVTPLGRKVAGEPGARHDGAWYRIVECYRAPDPYSPWTFPIQNGNSEDPAWIDYFVREMVRIVRAYELDAIHLDAATHDRPHDNGRLFAALAAQLPGFPICGEWCSSFDDVGYWALCQGATKSLYAGSENVSRARDCNSTPFWSGLPEAFAWLDKPSPVCAFSRDYFGSYLHLCAADAFVPVGKVCTVVPARKMPPDSAELERYLVATKRYGTIPNLRVNYRDYGLDTETRDAIRRHVVEGGGGRE